MLVVVLSDVAQAVASGGGGLAPAALAGIITAAVTAGAAFVGALTAWRKRQDEARKMDSEEDSITITQAQGANLVLDATVKALSAQLDRESARADRESARADRVGKRLRAIDQQLETVQARAAKLEQELDACRKEMTDSRGGGV